MTDVDMARQQGHNMKVKFVDNKDAFNIGYESFLAGLKAGRPEWHKIAEKLSEESREMTKDEILEYLFVCVCYKHNNDLSYQITKAALEKENKLFESAVKFLIRLDKEKHVLTRLNNS